MEEVRSKIAQYIAGEVKLEELIDSHRISVPVQKRFMFEDIWITMNRKIAEAIVSAEHPKRWKPTAIQKRRRNAVTVTDPQNRLMTNGKQWPRMEDWVVTADNKIRYGPMLQPLRKLGQDEWMPEGQPKPTEALEQLVASAPPLHEHQSPVSGSSMSDRTYQTYRHFTPPHYNAQTYMDSTS